MALNIDYPEILDFPNVQSFSDQELRELGDMLDSSIYVKYIEHILAHKLQEVVHGASNTKLGVEAAQLTAITKTVRTAQLVNLFYDLTTTQTIGK